MASTVVGKFAVPFINKEVHITTTGIRLGSKGKVMTDITDLLTPLDKGQRRQLRRELQRNGKGGLAQTGTPAALNRGKKSAGKSM